MGLFQTERQLTDMVLERAKEAFEVAGRYKGELPSDLYGALVELYRAVQVVEKRRG